MRIIAKSNHLQWAKAIMYLLLWPLLTMESQRSTLNDTSTVLPYFGKRKQVTYHLNLSYEGFHILPIVLFYAKSYA